LRPGQELHFVVAITNTGDAPIVSLQLSDSYPTAFLSFQGSQPPPDDNLNDGLLEWSQPALPLAPGASFTVTTTFRALADTGSLSGGAAQNIAHIEDVWAGGDGAPSPLPTAQSGAAVRILTPTGVVISDFSATPQTARVVLRWISDNESMVAGYRLLRTDVGARPVLLTPSPIPASHAGKSVGGEYHFLDESAVAAIPYTYTLQGVGLDGALIDLAVVAAMRWTLFLPLTARPTEQ
jgi:uncharacterized repeat protein (TIGR01451 family)